MSTRPHPSRSLDPSAECFERVVDVVDRWTVASFGHGPLTDQARVALDRALNRDNVSPWDRDIVERGYAMGDVDLVVNGNIGIVVVRQFSQGGATNLGRDIVGYAAAYDYLLVYLHGIARKHADRWRVVERHHVATRHGFEAIEFVHAPLVAQAGPTDDTGHRTLVPVLVALLVALLGVGILRSQEVVVVLGALFASSVVLLGTLWWYT